MFKTRYFMLFAAMLVVPAMACGGDKKDSDDTPPTGAAGETPVATRTAAGATPAGGTELAGTLQGFNRLRSFRANLVMEMPGQGRQEGVIESQLPDRFHITLGGLEMIAIGADTYLKVGATWTRAPVGGLGSLFNVGDLTASIQSYATDAAVTKGGTETVGGKRCQIYNYSASGTTSELCIADDKPVRVVTNAGGAKTTITFTDFDNVEVKAPI